MKRLLSTMKTDMTVQVRNNLYAIGIGVGLLTAAILSQLATAEQLSLIVPTLMLLVVGGTTLLYVAGMILFEKDEMTLNALMISPLRPSEYLWSKIITLTILATLEAIIIIGATMFIMSWSADLIWPNIPILLLGIIAIGIIYTLIGIILVVRYKQITDFLLPMAAVAIILQMPLLYFLGMAKLPILLVIPTSAPTLLMQGAYMPLETWQWLYAIFYTILLIFVLTFWAYRAFHTHIVMKVG